MLKTLKIVYPRLEGFTFNELKELKEEIKNFERKLVTRINELYENEEIPKIIESKGYIILDYPENCFELMKQYNHGKISFPILDDDTYESNDLFDYIGDLPKINETYTDKYEQNYAMFNVFFKQIKQGKGLIYDLSRESLDYIIYDGEIRVYSHVVLYNVNVNEKIGEYNKFLTIKNKLYVLDYQITGRNSINHYIENLVPIEYQNSE